MASKTPAGKKVVPAVNLADAAPALLVPADLPAFVPMQAGADKAAAAPTPPFVVSPEQTRPAASVSARAAAHVAKKKAVTASPIAEHIIAPSVAATEPTTKEETMDATTTAPFDAAPTDVADKAKTMFADANAKGTKAIAEMNEFGKGNIEAIVESGKIAARGIEAMGQDAAEFGRRQFEGATTAFKSMSTVKSPTDFFKLQSDFVRSSFDQLVAQTSKNTEALLKLAGDVAQPVSNRVAVAVEKAKIAA